MFWTLPPAPRPPILPLKPIRRKNGRKNGQNDGHAGQSDGHSGQTSGQVGRITNYKTIRLHLFSRL